MSRTPRNFDLDASTLRVVKDALRFRWLTDDQINRRYDVRPNCHPRALRDLVERGLLQPTTRWLQFSEVFVATKLGAQAAELDLPAQDVELRYLQHHIAVTDVADWLLDQEPGADWHTERELARFAALARSDGRDTDTRHRPDGHLLRPNGECIGIEVELTEKSSWNRYAQTCRWYAEQVEIDGLRWYVNHPRLLERIERVIAHSGLAQDLNIGVYPLPPGIEVRPWKR